MTVDPSKIIPRRRWRASFRLQWLIALVAVAAFVLALVHLRHLREIRKREEAIRLIAEGRALISEGYKKREAATLKLAETYRLQLDRHDHPARPEDRYMMGGTRKQNHLARMRKELPTLVERAKWERSMAQIARWAADHPRDIWPPTPPNPELKPATVASPGP